MSIFAGRIDRNVTVPQREGTGPFFTTSDVGDGDASASLSKFFGGKID